MPTASSTPSPINSNIGGRHQHLTISHHKVSPGAAALGSAAFQQMDEWAPYRMAFLILMVVSSIAIWASYKILCESDERNDEIIYQPLAAPIQIAQMEDEFWGIEDGNQLNPPIQSKQSESAYSLSSMEDDCLLLNDAADHQRSLSSKIR